MSKQYQDTLKKAAEACQDALRHAQKLVADGQAYHDDPEDLVEALAFLRSIFKRHKLQFPA